MALSDIFSNLQIRVRWLHVLLGILWIGNLYLLDFVIAPLQSAADTPEGNITRSALMLRGEFLPPSLESIRSRMVQKLELV